MQKQADAERLFPNSIKHWGVLCRGASQVQSRATISHNNTRDAGIEMIERHRVPLLAFESGSPMLFLVNATTFTNNAG